MRLLLDTHVFLWMALASDRMPDAIKAAIRSPANQVWLSAISVWEIAIKQGRGRLALPSPAVEFVTGHRRGHGIASLPVEEGAAAHLARLPLLHADPFDRMLVCQAIEHDLTIVTSDAQIQRYPVKTLWTVS